MHAILDMLVLVSNFFVIKFCNYQVCNKRCDSLGDEVRVRIEGTPSDLHAADARYLFLLFVFNT